MMKIKNGNNNSISFWVALFLIVTVTHISAMKTAYKLRPYGNRFAPNQDQAKKNPLQNQNNVRIYDEKDPSNYIIVSKDDIQWSGLFSEVINDTGSSEIPLVNPSIEVVKNIFKMVSLYKYNCDTMQRALRALTLNENIELYNAMSILLPTVEIEKCFLVSVDNKASYIMKRISKVLSNVRDLAEGRNKDFSSFDIPLTEAKIEEARASLDLLNKLLLPTSQEFKENADELEKVKKKFAFWISWGKTYLKYAKIAHEESKKFILFRKRWFS
jgi:hypothetical protein